VKTGALAIVRNAVDIAKTPGLRVDRDDGPFDQARMATDLAHTLLREGHRLIVPFDSDECWERLIPRLARLMARNQVNAVTGNVGVRPPQEA
jgi:hypothetical protein